MAKLPNIIHESFCEPFEGLELSSQVFYSNLQKLIESKKLPEVKCKKVTLSEGGILQHNREYLRVQLIKRMAESCGIVAKLEEATNDNSGRINMAI